MFRGPGGTGGMEVIGDIQITSHSQQCGHAVYFSIHITTRALRFCIFVFSVFALIRSLVEKQTKI